jgi:hypothetical protein
LSCPYTSPQNGRTERLIRTTNDIVRTLLFQATLPPTFWVEALYTANHVLNLRPSRIVQHLTPHFLLYGCQPSYNHLRTFGCLCFPNVSPTATHKLAPRSARCVFIGYPREQKGYRCLDLTTRKVHISRHVVFDESQFPYKNSTPDTTPNPSTPDPARSASIPLGIAPPSLPHFPPIPPTLNNRTTNHPTPPHPKAHHPPHLPRPDPPLLPRPLRTAPHLPRAPHDPPRAPCPDAVCPHLTVPPIPLLPLTLHHVTHLSPRELFPYVHPRTNTQ